MYLVILRGRVFLRYKLAPLVLPCGEHTCVRTALWPACSSSGATAGAGLHPCSAGEMLLSASDDQ